MRFYHYATLVAVLPGVALADPMTFDAALGRARQDAPSIRAMSLGVAAARSARDAAGALPDPTLAAGFDSFPVSGPLAFAPAKDDFSMVRIGVAQAIPNLAKRHAEQARADARITVAAADRAVTVRGVAVNTATAWINLAFAARKLDALDRVLAQLEQVVATTSHAVGAGHARPAQELAGHQAVAAMQDRRAMLVAEQARARAALTRWTGDPDPQISGTIPAFVIEPGQLRANLDRHPTIRMTEAEVSQSDADVRLADAGRRADFGVNLGYQRRDPRFGDYVSAGITVTLPMITRNRQNAEIGAAAANAGRAQAMREATLRALADEFDADMADHAMHHDQWLRGRDTLLPLAQQRVAFETASYGAGRASLVDVADAYAALADATLTAIDREATVAADGARLVLMYRSDDQ